MCHIFKLFNMLVKNACFGLARRKITERYHHFSGINTFVDVVAIWSSEVAVGPRRSPFGPKRSPFGRRRSPLVVGGRCGPRRLLWSSEVAIGPSWKSHFS